MEAKVQFEIGFKKENKAIWNEHRDNIVDQACEIAIEYGVPVQIVAHPNGVAVVILENLNGFFKVFFEPCFDHEWYNKSDWKDPNAIVKSYYMKKD